MNQTDALELALDALSELRDARRAAYRQEPDPRRRALLLAEIRDLGRAIHDLGRAKITLSRPPSAVGRSEPT